MIGPGPPPQLSRHRRRQRFWVEAAWRLAQGPILLAVTVVCMIVAAGLGRVMSPRLLNEGVTDSALAVGLIAGLLGASVAIVRAPVWLHRARLWSLRRSGRSATADAVWIDGEPTNWTVLEGYVVFVRWRDLAGEHLGDRCYRFWNGAPHDFISRFGRGQAVVVRYPAARPHRFIIDMPHAPTIVDAFI